MRTISALLLALLAVPASAQDSPPQGIGFAQAEEGTWMCRHEDPQEALSCAREQCAEQAPGQECWATAWCFPANWSGTMTVWLPDFHTTQVLCGAPSEKALTDALAALCAGDENATNCDFGFVIDPEGNERVVEGVSFPGPAAPPPIEAVAPPVGQKDGVAESGDQLPETATPDGAPPAADDETAPGSDQPAAGP
ncbi:MAG: hypothetical protein H0T75_05635 [Rhizobiales bacterium]|nr:hypothetical protein [Hyphomicrobiales bacterium]